MMKYMLLTSDPEYAIRAQEAGVDRIFLDLEYINKADRQKGRDTLICYNSVEDVAPLRKVLCHCELLVRINPINPHTEEEIDRIIKDGADIIMLPMVMDAEDVETAAKYINGRVRFCPMIETSQALTRVDDILDVKGIDEIFIGLNDLHICLGLPFLFEVLSGGLVEYLADKMNRRQIPFGFGGIAKIGEGLLPAEHILGEHYRLNSQSVILSRTFRGEIKEGETTFSLKEEIYKLRCREKEIMNWNSNEFLENQKIVKRCVDKIIGR